MTASEPRNYSLKRRIQVLAVVSVLVASIILTIGSVVVDHYVWHNHAVESRVGALGAVRALVSESITPEQVEEYEGRLLEIASANPDFWYYGEANGKVISSGSGSPRFKGMISGSDLTIVTPEQGLECAWFPNEFFAGETDPPLRGVLSRHCGGENYYVEVDGITAGTGFNHDLTSLFDSQNYVGYATRSNLLPSAILAVLLAGIVALLFASATTRIRNVSRAASRIGVDEHHLTLPEDDLPKEILPMVQAVNRAIGRLEAASEQQGLFLAAAAHELRTPLAVHRAHIEELPDGDLKERLGEDVQRMASMISQLLALAKLGASNRNFEEFDLATVVEETCVERGSAAINDGKELSFDVAENSATVLGDRVAVQTAVANLIDNALAFSEDGGNVSVRVAGCGVSVSDNGPGIAEGDIQQIFEPFYKNPPNKRGHGLGLAIVAEIMKMHKGSVQARNGNDGAVFELTFPNPESV